MCKQARERVTPVRLQPKTYPCPTCGRHGRRKRRLDRKVRSLAYGEVVWLHVHYAEYRARCACRKSFRSWVPDLAPKAGYDNLVRQAVLHRILDDGLNVERTRAALKRDFLREVSSGFVYDCLDWGLARLNQAAQRRLALRQFSGSLCVDELHLGEHTLLLATDPIADRVLGYSLVRVNDQAHLRRFPLTLSYWGFRPKAVVTDGSNLYPAVLQEVWPLTLLLKQANYREVPELAKAMGLLEGAKFDKMVAFLGCPAGARVRTNNHVERANRRLRFDEKVRYKFRSRRSLDRFLRLRLGLLDRQAASTRPAPGNPGGNPNTGPSSTSNRGGDSRGVSNKAPLKRAHSTPKPPHQRGVGNDFTCP